MSPTAALDPDVEDEQAAYSEPNLIEALVIPLAQVQDTHVSRKSNGATYVVVFEVGLEYLQQIADAGDGHLVEFQGKKVGEGADIRRVSMTKDADNNRHVKFAFQFAQSEIRVSLGRMGAAIAGDSEGELVITPSHLQQQFDLTTRAE